MSPEASKKPGSYLGILGIRSSAPAIERFTHRQKMDSAVNLGGLRSNAATDREINRDGDIASESGAHRRGLPPTGQLHL
jgi:hypothetical protein